MVDMMLHATLVSIVSNPYFVWLFSPKLDQFPAKYRNTRVRNFEIRIVDQHRASDRRCPPAGLEDTIANCWSSIEVRFGSGTVVKCGDVVGDEADWEEVVGGAILDAFQK